MKEEVNKNISLYTFCFLAVTCSFYLLAFSSCRKLISVDSPKTELTFDKVFSSDNSAIAAVSNIYTGFENYSLEGDLMPFVSLYADEIYPTTANGESMMYYNNAISLDDYTNANIWKDAYFIVYQCNAILANVPHSTAITLDTRKQVSGEAEFLRAFAYCFLVNLYGDVPLVLSGNIKLTAGLPRDSVADIYKQIVLDLKDAENNLSAAYPTHDKTRTNKWCAAALLARVYLYNGDWKDAAEESSEVINSGEYGLDSLNNVFLKSSKATILQCWQQNGYTRTGSVFIPSTANEIPVYAIDSSLLNSFQQGDRRKTCWLDSVITGGETYYYPFKYKQRSTATGKNAEYTVLLRLGEQYLIRAEARAHQNDLQGAIGDLNMIRKRAGLSNLPQELSQSELLAAVRQERRVELFTEWGHRFFDLKRTGRIDEALKAVKPSWKSTAQFYPIPQNELNNNPRLTQNAGY